MKSRNRHFASASIVALAFSVIGTAHAESVDVPASQDNTLYEDSIGEVSNGAGWHMFTGRTNFGELRRAILQFDIASYVPEGSTITGVTLTLHVSQTQSGPFDHTLHRVTKAWGEGDSDAQGNEGFGAQGLPPDCTWQHSMLPDQLWDNDGGDYIADPSASSSVTDIGTFPTWSSETMVADVQGWLNDPAGNHGWILIGFEKKGFFQTTKRFDTKDHGEPSVRPKLTVEFEAGDFCPEDLSGDDVVDTVDLLDLLGAWGECPKDGCPQDLNDDGFVDTIDLLQLLGAWGPCPVP